MVVRTGFEPVSQSVPRALAVYATPRTVSNFNIEILHSNYNHFYVYKNIIVFLGLSKMCLRVFDLLEVKVYIPSKTKNRTCC